MYNFALSSDAKKHLNFEVFFFEYEQIVFRDLLQVANDDVHMHSADTVCLLSVALLANLINV